MKKIFIIGMMTILNIVFFVYSSDLILHKADIVIFSYNRPLQLYALLESLQLYCQGINEIHVIYRSGNESFDQGYALLIEDFSYVHYHKQGSNYQKNFKELTLQAAFNSPSSYIIFAVDDIVVKEEIDIVKCIEALEKYHAYGFYFRLGTNLTTCYSWGSVMQPLPPFKEEEPNLFSWHFSQGTFDWRYPHTVDMTLYRKKDIIGSLRMYSYHTPNKLEDIWNLHAQAIIHHKGLCCLTSKIVNLPLNRVQNEYKNRFMHEWNQDDLLQKFLLGEKMDISPLYGINNSAAHMEYSPTFINR